MRTPLAFCRLFPLVGILVLVLSARPVSAQLPTPGPDSPWLLAPQFFPKGALIDFEQGDPHRQMPVRIVLVFRKKWRMPPHVHPQAVHLEVRQGSLAVGLGDRMDIRNTRTLATGDTLTVPAGAAQFMYAVGDPTMVAISCMGPIRITYVHPEDDPSRSLPFGR